MYVRTVASQAIGMTVESDSPTCDQNRIPPRPPLATLSPSVTAQKLAAVTNSVTGSRSVPAKPCQERDDHPDYRREQHHRQVQRLNHRTFTGVKDVHQ